MIDHAVDHISKFLEEDRERLASAMLREDGRGNYTVHPTYDALLIKYLPELLLGLTPNVNQPLPTPTSSIAELDQLSNKIQKETAFYLTVLLERELKEVCEIEAKIQKESLLTVAAPVAEQPVKDKFCFTWEDASQI